MNQAFSYALYSLIFALSAFSFVKYLKADNNKAKRVKTLEKASGMFMFFLCLSAFLISFVYFLLLVF